MEFQEFNKKLKRMCKSVKVGVNCSKCEFYTIKHGGACGYYVMNEPEKAEAIVRKWADEHPIVTNRMKYKEVFGSEPIKEISGAYICPPVYAYKNCELVSISCAECKKWWDEEYKEPEKEVKS